MELWIRSQDKEELIPIKNKLKIYESDLIQTSIKPYRTERHFNIIHGTDFLGEYKSKERALAVIEDIQNILKPKVISRTADLEQKIDDLVLRTKEITPISDCIVYEMPQE